MLDIFCWANEYILVYQFIAPEDMNLTWTQQLFATTEWQKQIYSALQGLLGLVMSWGVFHPLL
ncbi:hypothetical protein J3U68_06290 [Snodgrassella sp. B3882]|uniref:hypothetical protein n=1 Tax=Snodgrassella sp. B3882 TaxID=2818037 RepID=UPI002269993F|nr:hypothetical protein [Snodgrassella sp. B3882]MCX8745021.1 hypothetical protein [Snodgrassella sp. B3882]